MRREEKKRKRKKRKKERKRQKGREAERQLAKGPMGRGRKRSMEGLRGLQKHLAIIPGNQILKPHATQYRNNRLKSFTTDI